MLGRGVWGLAEGRVRRVRNGVPVPWGARAAAAGGLGGPVREGLGPRGWGAERAWGRGAEREQAALGGAEEGGRSGGGAPRSAGSPWGEVLCLPPTPPQACLGGFDKRPVCSGGI